MKKFILDIKNIWFNNHEKIADFIVLILSGLVFLCGIILLLSCSAPGIIGRLSVVAKVTSLEFMRLSHRIAIIIGFMLLVLSKGIKDHIKRAYTLTMIMLISGAIFTFTKGLDYEEALFLLFVALLLWFSRNRYYRESTKIKPFNIFTLIFITVVSIMFYNSLGHTISFEFIGSDGNRKAFAFFINRKEFMANAIYAFIVAWIILFIYIVLKPKRPFEKNITEEEFQKFSEFLKKYDGTFLSHLLYLKDKNFYWAQDEKVLIAYANIRDKLIVLGDPIGDEKYFTKAIQEFQRFADKYALYPAFYQVSEKYLTMYHENGYYFFKLGEEAVVDLEKFNLEGGKKKDLRLVRNRFEKANLKFEIVYPPFTYEFIEELRIISEEWLNGRKEKGFSLGWFDEEYINRAGVAIIKDETNKILAFATLMPKYDDDKTMSIDLMRFTKESPNGTMDTLFLKLILWSQEQGYKYFNLGMAPLSNVGVTPYAHKQEKMARLVYKFGNNIYGFSGLRRYKSKFDPDWEPRFLAYPQFMSLPTLIIDITMLVSKVRKSNKKLNKY